MVESSDDPSLLDRIRSHAHAWKHHRSTRHDADPPARPTAHGGGQHASATGVAVADDTSAAPPPPAPPPPESSQPPAIEGREKENKEQPDFASRFWRDCKEILCSSWVNVLLVFVPVGIATNFAGISPTIVFVANAIAIVPLAGLLAHATESVAASMGDTLGALLNVSFGNAVELILFIIALVKNEIRIVQASLLGSLLANLLLILGMAFAIGGLRYREQIYNSTVTQMSACLLSLSVMSLLLPTAFHASFSDTTVADSAVLKVSRGTSVILLLVYILYLLFQLKSHAYMYESTPQHVIDEESHPGVLADMLNAGSSSDTSSSSSDDDSDESHTTAERIKRALRGRRRRKSSASSKEAPSSPSTVGASAFEFMEPMKRHRLGAIASGDEADGEEDGPTLRSPTTVRDFENEKQASGSKSPEAKPPRMSKRKARKQRREAKKGAKEKMVAEEIPSIPAQPEVSFVQDPNVLTIAPDFYKRPFNLRGISVRPVPIGFLTNTVFSTANPTGPSATGIPLQNVVPRAPYGLRRTISLPDRLNNTKAQSVPPLPYMRPAHALSMDVADDDKKAQYLSRTSAIFLLLASTALCAVCADFLVSSIQSFVNNTGVSTVFVGLIVLPIVGNAAEHVTAVTVAAKNKMDLAISVAVGSSIQIALFVTPIIVLLGWVLNKDMSLFFSLFETVSLFASAFIVNFLVLDGRSNYLEGMLLMAGYVIIAVAAFFYPSEGQQSLVGGSTGNSTDALQLF